MHGTRALDIVYNSCGDHYYPVQQGNNFPVSVFYLFSLPKFTVTLAYYPSYNFYLFVYSEY